MHRLFFALTLCAFAAIVTSCSHKPFAEQAISPIFKAGNVNDSQKYKAFIGKPQPEAYSICLHNTCHDIAFVSLSKQQWQQVMTIFSIEAASAEIEREHIKQAIALLETMTGQQTLTHLDRAKNNLAKGITGQMDCIDEATNTTVYLRLIAEADLLKWHQQAPRISRGILTGNAPHTTATIIETASQQRFVVDSWFEDNGEQPHVVPLAEWQSGWKPAE